MSTTVQTDAEEMLRDGALTIATLKSEFGISRSRAYELMTSGDLPYTTCGRKRLIPRRAVVTLLARGLTTGVASVSA